MLRSVNYSETSKILTLYSRACGKVSVIAKGARNIKNRFGGILEPANYLEIVFYARENRELQFLNQAELIESFPGTKSNLEKTALAMAVCELLDRLETGQEPNPLLFRLQLSVLRHINDTEESAHNIFRAFQIHISDIMGFRPHFDNCVGCRCSLFGKVDFDLAAGGLVCAACKVPDAAEIRLSNDALESLRKLQRVHISKLSGLLPSKTLQRQVDDFLKYYLRYHVEGFRELKSLQFLASISP